MMQDSAGAVIGALIGSWLLQYDFHFVCWTGAAILCWQPVERLVTPRLPYLDRSRPDERGPDASVA